MPCSRPILVIEDDPDLRDNLQEALELEGYEAVTAAHGVEALRLLDDAPLPGAILLDLMMPVMSGAEFLATLRRERPELAAAVPIMVLTASGEAHKYRDLTTEVLQKPVNLERLISLLEKHCAAA